MSYRISLPALKILPIVSLLSLGVTSLAPAQTRVWSGSGGNNNWQNGANWVGGTAPGTNGNARIDNPARTAVIGTSTGTVSLSTLYVGQFGGGNGSLRIQDSGVLNVNILNVADLGTGEILVRDGGRFTSNLAAVGLKSCGRHDHGDRNGQQLDEYEWLWRLGSGGDDR